MFRTYTGDSFVPPSVQNRGPWRWPRCPRRSIHRWTRAMAPSSMVMVRARFPLPCRTRTLPRSGLTSGALSSRASSTLSPARYMTVINALFRIPVGALLEHCRRSAATSALVSGSAGYLEGRPGETAILSLPVVPSARRDTLSAHDDHGLRQRILQTVKGYPATRSGTAAQPATFLSLAGTGSPSAAAAASGLSVSVYPAVVSGRACPSANSSVSC